MSVYSAFGHRRHSVLSRSLSQLFYNGEDTLPGLGTLDVFHLCNFTDMKSTHAHTAVPPVLKLMSLMQVTGHIELAW